MVHTRCINEVWKDIEGYEGLYKVSNFGRVKSLERTCICGNGFGIHLLPEKILKCNNKRHYLGVRLCKDGKYENFLVHRLVAIAFIENPENKPYINHIDCDPHNNNVNNLEWCTPKENTEWCIKMGRHKGSEYFKNMSVEQHKINSKKCEKAIKAVNIKTGETIYFDSQKNAAQQLKCSEGNISSVLNGRLKQTKGYTFRYADPI